MSDVNEVTIRGELDETPELRHTRSGTPVANPTIITRRSWTDSSDEEKSSREFHRCVCWGGLGEKAAGLQGGTRVEAQGRLQTRKWEDSDGRTRYTTEIVCSEFDRVDAEEPETQTKQAKQLDGARRSGTDGLSDFADDAFMQDDDLPF